jgi:serine protease Do
MSTFRQFAIISLVLAALASAQETPAPAVPVAPPAPVVRARPAPAPAAVAALAAPAVAAAVAEPADSTAPAAKPAKPSTYLGVDIRDVTQDRMAALKLKDARGIEIMLVDQDSPAGKAGLKEHDVILSFNGRNLQGSEDLRKLIRETQPGQTVELGISRDGKPMTIKAQLADRHRVMVMAPRVQTSKILIPRIAVPIITTLSRRDGVLVENLTTQLGEVFGVKDGEGVLIRSVEKGSPGEAAGLRAGDVIVRVGNQKVTGTSDWNRLLREQKPGPVQLGIMREKRSQTISLNVPERSPQSDGLPGMEEFHLNMEGFGHDMEEYRREMLELQRLQPEIERSMREAQTKMQRELERSQHEWERASERAQREAERAQEQARRDVERSQREMERAQRESERAREQAERDQEKSTPEPPANPPAPPAQPPSPPK